MATRSTTALFQWKLLIILWFECRHLYGGYTSVVITSTNAYIVLKPEPWVLNDPFIKEIFVTKICMVAM